ncbi:hypothetical protein COHA_009116 [Chlorella ohadii]|uniref:Sulfotransferase n=1 Tax=Chlorella ohadii TaxID=2649997 RepID=A0AAD5DIQ9_9CHLO|nr:hypothetical protein COHA_009116 [Chlorella ohadii]
MTQQPAEQQQAQQADSQPAAEQQAAQAQPAGSRPAEGKAGQQQQQAPTQQEEWPTQQQEQQKQQEQQQAQQPEAQQAPAPPAKRGIDIYREFQANVSSCFNEWAGLECLRQQKDWTPGPGQYRFPHFAIIGFQKCATTSLFHHLAQHPQVLHSFPKEPEFFTETCNFNALRCNRSAQFQYMRDVLRFVDAQSINFTAAAFEGSTHYALEGRWLAPQMAHLFPWLRMIVSMREPISQAISMVFHNLDSNRNVGCYQRGNGQIYRCGLEYLEDESRYANWLKPWLAAYPPEQLYLFQYENLTATENTMGALRDLKRWLGVAKALPNDELPVSNARHQTKQTEGWPMLRWQYWKLVEKARRNMMEVVEIVEQYGYADPEGWVKNWEAWWQMNLDERCGAAPDSECMILLS